MQGRSADSHPGFQSIPSARLSAGLGSVSVKGAAGGGRGGSGRGGPKPNYEASMGTAVTTSSGLEPIQGTLT